MREVWLKVVGEESVPCVVPKMNHPLACVLHLSDQIVFLDLLASEVAAHVDEGGQCARCEPFQPLHRGRRRVGDKG